MNVWNWLRQTPLWLVVPSVFLAAGVATAVTHYEPLVFDPSLYEVQTASAAELETKDAEAIEAANEADEPPVEVDLAAPASKVSTAQLADGEWTGYAACGQGNPDGWKPYYVGVSIRVSGGKSQGITRVFGSSTGNSGQAKLSWDAAENQSYLDWADAGRNGETGVRAQVNAMASSGSLSGIDTVSKATYSSAAIYNAYVDALNKASSAAGNASTAAPVAADGGKDDGKRGRKQGKDSSKKSEITEAESDVGTLADGTWTAFAQCGPDPDDEWKPYYVGLTLTVKDGEVTSIDRIVGTSRGEKGSERLDWDENENLVYLTWAIEGRTRSGVEYAGVKAQIEQALAAGSNPTSVDVVSGATFSSKSVFEAFYAALAKSAEAAGASVEIPEPDDETVDDEINEGSGSDKTDSAQNPDVAVEPSEDAEPTSDIPSMSGDFPDGTYSGHALCGVGNEDGWQPYYLVVEVEASGGKIVRVANAYGDADGKIDPKYVYDGAENSVYLNRALNYNGLRLKGVKTQVQAKLDSGEEVPGIDVISNATYSCNAFLEAFYEAVRCAHEQVGSVDEQSVSEGDSPEEGQGE